MSKNELITLARDLALKHDLQPEVVMGVIEQESEWDTFSYRYEPAFRIRYVKPLGLKEAEEIYRSTSWGLMQVMGQVARELGFAGKCLAALCEPELGIAYGCRHLASKIAVHSGDVLSGLLAYNGGSNPNYGLSVLAKSNYYKNARYA